MVDWDPIPIDQKILKIFKNPFAKTQIYGIV